MKRYLLPLTLLLAACGSEGKVTTTPIESELAAPDYCSLFCIDAVQKMGSLIREQTIELTEFSALQSECQKTLEVKQVQNDTCKKGIQNLDAMTKEEFVSYCHSTNWVLTKCE
jgi:hypothetical protein